MKSRFVTLILAIGIASSTVSCTSRRTSQYWQKMVVLGFDGMDPDLVAQWIKEGKLPNLRRLAEQGGL